MEEKNPFAIAKKKEREILRYLGTNLARNVQNLHKLNFNATKRQKDNKQIENNRFLK